MNKIKRILAAIDFSEYSEEVISYAIDLARSLEAELIVANVINQRDLDIIKSVILDVDRIPLGDFISHGETQRRSELRDLMKEKAPETVKYQTVIRIGVPFIELISLVKENNIDLVVIGSKGCSNLMEVYFGATAEKMFRYSTVPVLTIRNPEHHSHVYR